MRSAGLEAPFVGRDRELRLVKELFHASAEERRAAARLGHRGSPASASRGSPGSSRSTSTAWPRDAFWHRGRCLSYGEGVAYWALAEMVRMRCGIAEDEEPASARAKLRRTLEEHLPDTDERRWVEPRLAHLLGLEDGIAGRPGEPVLGLAHLLRAARRADPTVLVFEDVQWADAGLLDFIEYLLDWSRNQPLFVLALARPEFAEKRPTWGRQA